PDTLEATVVWVSGAVTPLTLHPPIQPTADLGGYETFVARVLALGAAGYQDQEIAWWRRSAGRGGRSRAPSKSRPRPSSTGSGRCSACARNWACIATGCTRASEEERSLRRGIG